MALTPETTKPKPGDLIDRMGAWANRHRRYFRSHKGELIFRNALNSFIDWIPTVGTFLLTRAAWGKYEQFAQKNPKAIWTTVAKPFLDRKEYPVGSMVPFIFGGWFAYRATRRLFFRTYDRLFAAQTPQEAADSIRAMPHNFISDAKEIIPGGIAEVVPGSFALASIRGALTPKTNHAFVDKNMWSAARKGWLNETLAAGIAYSAFTEISDHVYPLVTHGKDSEAYYRALQGRPAKEEMPPGLKHFGFFTNDNAPRMVFKTTASVLLGFAAYFVGQRGAKAAFGLPKNLPEKGENMLNFLSKNFAVDYVAWVPFTAYTVIAQVYKEQYDKLFDKLEKWASGKDSATKGRA